MKKLLMVLLMAGSTVFLRGDGITLNGSINHLDTAQAPREVEKHFPVKNIRKVIAKAITGTIHIEQCPDPKNCIEALTLLGDISPLLQVTLKGNELVFDSTKGFAEMPHIECRLTVKKMENIVNEGPGHIININTLLNSGSVNATNYGSGSISSTNYFNF